MWIRGQNEKKEEMRWNQPQGGEPIADLIALRRRPAPAVRANRGAAELPQLVRRRVYIEIPGGQGRRLEAQLIEMGASQGTILVQSALPLQCSERVRVWLDDARALDGSVLDCHVKTQRVVSSTNPNPFRYRLHIAIAGSTG